MKKKEQREQEQKKKKKLKKIQVKNMRVRKRNKPCGFVLFGNRTLPTPIGRECTKNEKKRKKITS